jgi:hypothetical protein
MPSDLTYFIARLRANAPSLRRTALIGALTYSFYLGLWYFWRSEVSNIPGFLFLFGSFPWSLPWLEIESHLLNFISWPVRNFINSIAVASGFGINCALIRAIAGTLWSAKNNV